MTISYIPKKEFPFGGNIHFACGLSSGEFLFIHPLLDWIFSGHIAKTFKNILPAIDAEEAVHLKNVLCEVRSGNFSRKVTFNC